MDPTLAPLISGFVGALVGAAASVCTIIVQSHYQGRRELRRMAYEAAVEDFKMAHDIAKSNNAPAQIAPLTAFLHFHSAYLKLLDEGALTAESHANLKEERNKLFGAP
jgi:hypothetical protein